MSERRRATRGWLPIVTGLALVLAAHPARAQDAAPQAAPPEPAPQADLSVESDRITARFVAMPVDQALQQIVDASGADLVGAVDEPKPVTVTFDDVPLEQALTRLLGKQSFSLVFDGEGALRRIRLIGAAAPAAAGAVKVAQGKPGDVLNTSQLMATEVPISTIGPLADQLGRSGSATLGKLLDLAMRSEDASTRVAAVDASMAAVERDATLQNSVDALWQGVDDQTMANVVRSAAGQRSTEFMSRILSRTRRPEFRQRIVSVLRLLRENAS